MIWEMLLSVTKPRCISEAWIITACSGLLAAVGGASHALRQLTIALSVLTQIRAFKCVYIRQKRFSQNVLGDNAQLVAALLRRQ